MITPIEITSNDNKNFKLLFSLQKKRERNKTNLFIVEGIKEINMALESGLKIRSLWISEEKKSVLNDFDNKINNETVSYYLKENLFKKVCFKNDTEGVLAIFEKFPELDLKNIKINDKSCIIVLDDIKKPGNIGAILRTADAIGATVVFLTNQKTDIYNQTAIRSSVGTFFTVPWKLVEQSEILSFLRQNSFTIISADPKSDKYHFEVKYPLRSAFIFGNEHAGLSDFWLKNFDLSVKIPMLGKNDSLNVNVSCGVLLYEWVRNVRF